MTGSDPDPLLALLQDPPRRPDIRFVNRVESTLRAERALRVHVHRGWRRFAVELAGGVAAASAAAIMATQPALAGLDADRQWLAVLLVAAAPIVWAGANRWRVTA